MSVPALIPLDVMMFEPILNNMVSSYIEFVKNNNSTKVALAKIDSEMQIAISKIQEKANRAGEIVQVCSDMMQKTLINTSLTFEQQTALIDKFTTTMLDTLDKF